MNTDPIAQKAIALQIPVRQQQTLNSATQAQAGLGSNRMLTVANSSSLPLGGSLQQVNTTNMLLSAIYGTLNRIANSLGLSQSSSVKPQANTDASSAVQHSQPMLPSSQLPESPTQAKSKIEDSLTRIVSTLENVVGSIQQAFKSVVEIVSKLGNLLSGKTDSGESLSGLLKETGKGLLDSALGIFSPKTALLGPIATGISSLADKAGSFIKKIF